MPEIEQKTNIPGKEQKMDRIGELYKHFTFEDGSNPYITKTNVEFWKMLKNYDVEMVTNFSFKVIGKKQTLSVKPLTPYERNQSILRDFAIEWQFKFADLTHAWRDLCEWSDFFEEYGRKYGLIREFKENGII